MIYTCIRGVICLTHKRFVGLWRTFYRSSSTPATKSTDRGATSFRAKFSKMACSAIGVKVMAGDVSVPPGRGDGAC